MVNAVFNLLSDVRFIVGVNNYFLCRYDAVHTELNIVSYSLSSSIHIQPMKGIPLCAEEASFKGLNDVLSPDFNSLSLWFAAFEDCFVRGDEVDCFVVWVWEGGLALLTYAFSTFPKHLSRTLSPLVPYFMYWWKPGRDSSSLQWLRSPKTGASWHRRSCCWTQSVM